MNWEYVNEYAWETLGEVRFSPLPKDPTVADREANTRITQTNKDWSNGNGSDGL